MKFLRALHPKWRAKVTTIEESKDFLNLSLDKIIGNLKVIELVMEKDFEIVKGKKDKYKSIALEAKMKLIDDETSTSGSEDEEYVMDPQDDKKGKSQRKCFRCGDSSHFIEKCPKPSRKDQKAFIGGSWNDSGEDNEVPKKGEVCIMAQDSNEVQSDSSFYNSSIDDDTLQTENNKLCELCLKIITKNKFLKTNREFLENEVYELKEKMKHLKKRKAIDEGCISCQGLGLEIEKLKLNQEMLIKQNSNFAKFEKSARPMDPLADPVQRDLASLEKGYVCYTNLGQNARNSSRTNFVIVSRKSKPPINHIKQKPSLKQGVGLTKNEFRPKMPQPRVCLKAGLESNKWIKDSGCSKHMTGKENLFSSYQAYDRGRGLRKNGHYVMKIDKSPRYKLCLTTIDDNSTLCHRRLGHVNMRLIQSLSSKELVRNLPNLKYDQHFYEACKIGKQVHASHKAKNLVSTSKCLELLHMDLFGPSAIQKIQNQTGSPIMLIRTDHGPEFDNEVQFEAFCDANGITQNFSDPCTPQSNGVVERKTGHSKK
ncbi:retrovirus-related pol polyprotein from transposon TNT 1-94 [Tanacetum coccineum]